MALTSLCRLRQIILLLINLPVGKFLGKTLELFWEIPLPPSVAGTHYIGLSSLAPQFRDVIAPLRRVMVVTRPRGITRLECCLPMLSTSLKLSHSRVIQCNKRILFRNSIRDHLSDCQLLRGSCCFISHDQPHVGKCHIMKNGLKNMIYLRLECLYVIELCNK